MFFRFQYLNLNAGIHTAIRVLSIAFKLSTVIFTPPRRETAIYDHHKEKKIHIKSLLNASTSYSLITLPRRFTSASDFIIPS